MDAPGFAAGWDLGGVGQIGTMRFCDLVVREGYLHVIRQAYAVEPDAGERLLSLGTPKAHYQWPGSEEWLFRVDGTLVFIEAYSASVWGSIAARTALEAECARDRLAELFGVTRRPEGEVAMTFWAHGCDGVTSVHRRASAPAWAEIRRSYSESVRTGLARLLEAREPNGGRLVLWHGPPGGGKTYALRSLVRGWQDWCAPHFVTDPEVLLGEESAYMLQVLTSPDREPLTDRSWRLIVLEDAGELLGISARRETGQALSRLLNVTDGLIGQGMNSIVLVTTNEPLSRLHPAVTRPGRCWIDVEFGPLPPKQANAWLRKRGSKARVTGPTALAGLYALVNGGAGGGEPALAARRHAIGFAQSLSG